MNMAQGFTSYSEELPCTLLCVTCSSSCCKHFVLCALISKRKRCKHIGVLAKLPVLAPESQTSKLNPVLIQCSSAAQALDLEHAMQTTCHCIHKYLAILQFQMVSSTLFVGQTQGGAPRGTRGHKRPHRINAIQYIMIYHYILYCMCVLGDINTC